jgi:hypothetical protein
MDTPKDTSTTCDEVMAATSLEFAAAVKNSLAAYGIIAAGEIQVFLAVLDKLGLFHSRPGEKGITTKKTMRTIKKAGSFLERLKRLAEICQVNRGGRITPVPSTVGRRSDPERNRAIQILDAFLSERYPAWSFRKREECIAGVLRAAGDQGDDLQFVKARIHNRLQNSTKTPLDAWDYKLAIHDALGTRLHQNLQRSDEFWRLNAEVNDMQLTDEQRSEAEAKLGELFGFAEPEKVDLPICQDQDK